jgi:hypothetical protein
VPRRRHLIDEKHRQRLRGANFGSAIYGEILVLSVLAAIDHAHLEAGLVLQTVVASQLVFWLAHAYSESINRQLHAGIEGGDSIGWRGVAAVMEHEWPLAQAAVPAALLMVLSLLGALEPRTGVDIAFGIGVVQLIGWGIFSARRGGRPLAAQLLVGALSGGFGLLIVLLKLLIH